MNNKIKDYIEELEEFDSMFRMVVFDNYFNKVLPTKTLSRFQRIYFECTSSREYEHMNCTNCVYRLIYNLGRMYLNYKDANKEEVTPYEPKLSKSYKPKTIKNGTGKE